MDNKIVTNFILSEKLDVSLSEAKYLLEKYVSDQSISPGKISVTYLICGKLKTGGYGIQIIDSASKEKQKLYSSLTQEVVYSVQKSNTIDFSLIALAGESLSENLREKALKGSIVSKRCTERLLKTKVLPPLPPQKNFEKQKPSSFFKPVSKPTNGLSETSTSEPNQSKNNVKTQNQKKPGGISSFFSQTTQSQKKDDQKEKRESSNEEDERETKRAKISISDSEGIGTNTKETKNEQDIDENDSNQKSLSSGKNGETHNGSIVENKKAVNKESSKKKGNQNGKKKAGQDGKKRKRIIVDSDSDDDLFGNDEDETMEVVASDEEIPIVAQPKLSAVPVPRNKRRKAVEKTFQDDEGYIVTRTEYVLVSASEDEDEENKEVPKKEVKSNVISKTENKEEKKSPP
ncbi:hypothetical protein HHI36_015579 [Cryptolaemus montrouzieri]|uniref:DNA polymerase delta subunit 3 n=1 Tax=Cryptolaemus montrouzieri TaxID=559131 RepID=A0ABD2N644_9CUCU